MVAHVLLLLDYSGHRGRDRMVAHVLLLLDYIVVVIVVVIVW